MKITMDTKNKASTRTTNIKIQDHNKVTPNNGNKVAPAGVILTVADLEVDSVWVHDEQHNMYELQYDAFNFSPAIDDNIRVLNKGDKQLVTLVRNDSSQSNAAPSINIINNNENNNTNENTNTNANTNLNLGYGKARRVNKYVYILLMFFGSQYFLRKSVGKSLLYLCTFGFLMVGLALDVIQVIKHFSDDKSYFYFDAYGDWI